MEKNKNVVNEYRKLKILDLEKKETELKHELFGIRFKMHVGGLEKVHNIQKIKKDIARVKTIINEKKKEIRK
mgnify:CR=1 FL=1